MQIYVQHIRTDPATNIQAGADVTVDGVPKYMTLRELVKNNGFLENAVFLQDDTLHMMRLRLYSELEDG